MLADAPTPPARTASASSATASGSRRWPARLIAEHGLTDWTLAKRKAVRQLLLPDTTALPSNEEIEAALTDHHALFGGDAHVADAARAADRGARVDASARAVGSGAGRRRRGRMGHRTQRSPPRARRRRSEGRGDRPRGRRRLLRRAAAARGRSRPRICASNRRGSPMRLAIVTPLQRRNRPRKSEEPRLDCRSGRRPDRVRPEPGWVSVTRRASRRRRARSR